LNTKAAAGFHFPRDKYKRADSPLIFISRIVMVVLHLDYSFNHFILMLKTILDCMDAILKVKDM